MIVYDGTKKVNRVHYIIFKNDSGKTIDVPLDTHVFNQFMIYFDKLQPAEHLVVERGNDEEP